MNRALLVTAWLVVAGASTLPRVILQELLHVEVTDDVRTAAAASVIGSALVVAAAATRLRPLVPFLVVFLTLVAAEWLVFRVIDQAPAYRAWLADPSFVTYMLAEQSLRLMVTCLVLVALVALRRRPERFFLAAGDLHAPMRAIRWLGVKEGTRWSRFGPIAALCLSGGTLVFLLAAGRPSADLVARAAPFLPAVFLAAALTRSTRNSPKRRPSCRCWKAPSGGGRRCGW